MLKCQLHKTKDYYNKKKSVDKYSIIVMSFVFYDSENDEHKSSTTRFQRTKLSLSLSRSFFLSLLSFSPLRVYHTKIQRFHGTPKYTHEMRDLVLMLVCVFYLFF